MRFSSYVFLWFCAAVFLSGCSHLDPQPMGRGYSSYDEAYKSVRGADAKNVGYDFSVENNEAVIEDMRFAAQDLVRQLDDNLSFSVDEVYLVVPQKGVFYSSFDYVLRDELTKRGYGLAATPQHAHTVEFVARESKATEGSASIPAAKNNPYRKLYLALAMDIVEDVPGTVVGGAYEVPAYGFQPSDRLDLTKQGECCCKKVCEKKQDCGKEKCAEEICEKPEGEAGGSATVPEVGAPVDLKGGVK